MEFGVGDRCCLGGWLVAVGIGLGWFDSVSYPVLFAALVIVDLCIDINGIRRLIIRLRAKKQ